MNPLLEVRHAGKDYPARSRSLLGKRQTLVAVDRVSLTIAAGETLGLVGESGSGKSTLGRLICRLEEPTRGSIRFDGQEISGMPDHRLRELRGRFQPVFQDPLNSLNPRRTVTQTVEEPLRLHGHAAGPEDVRARLEHVGLGPELLRRYPHQLSGGQRQRVVLARALAVRPDLLIADEPVSSLDVSIQAQILNLLLDLQRELHLAMLFISHDLRVVGHVADRVAVMYLGRIMESAPARDLYRKARHPYTRALLEALPRLQPGRGRRRSVLTGEAPSPVDPIPGCRFFSRCPYREEACRNYENDLLTAGPGHMVACRRWGAVSPASEKS